MNDRTGRWGLAAGAGLFTALAVAGCSGEGGTSSAPPEPSAPATVSPSQSPSPSASPSVSASPTRSASPARSAPRPGRTAAPPRPTQGGTAGRGHGSGTTIEQNPKGYGTPVPRTPPTPDWTPATGFPTDAVEVPMPTQLG
ncbi:hypothetical protein PV350_06765 [Streptomyces sp. PA03-6a]|nr:hypothetical protein [Streptomyces sp. PA03-6a]